jgi:hypothetical protein
MKITEIVKSSVPVYYITTDEAGYNVYRRSGWLDDSEGCNWEIAMGESWETLYIEAPELEEVFQKQLAKEVIEIESS